MKIMKNLIIGIDTGVNTGMGVVTIPDGKIVTVKSGKIINIMAEVLAMREQIAMMFIEDARQVRFKTIGVRSQGAGSVKRDASIWEDFCTMYKIPYKMCRPQKRITKVDSATFKKLTKWEKTTNSHSRDAALLAISNYQSIIKRTSNPIVKK